MYASVAEAQVQWQTAIKRSAPVTRKWIGFLNASLCSAPTMQMQTKKPERLFEQQQQQKKPNQPNNSRNFGNFKIHLFQVLSVIYVHSSFSIKNALD